MPASFMTLFPGVLNTLETLKFPLQTSVALSETAIRSQTLGVDLMRSTHDFAFLALKRFLPLILPEKDKTCGPLLETCREGFDDLLELFGNHQLEGLRRFHRKRQGELEFLRVFTDEPAPQDWTVEYDDTRVLLDLPGLRLIDISVEAKHKVNNYAAVFAPRAGHHSNIAERVALFMRDQGLTRMAIVEQKCAEDIPLHVDGQKHDEGFNGQAEQYRQILEHLRDLTGHPPHLIAVCQPGPLLASTLILHPHLGKTFGSVGAPMHTEGERGFLTDFARLVGEGYIDRLVTLFGQTVAEDKLGAGREIYDGRLQVLGFYVLGIDQHFRNLTRLLTDLRQGNRESAERQQTFYQWYNYVLHFPAGFVSDTFKKIFIRNELIKGTLTLNGKRIGIKDYPASVPIWALGGTKDDIAPLLHATGHMDLIDQVPEKDKLVLHCEAGHMGLFRSRKVLENYYGKIVEFIMARSDMG